MSTTTPRRITFRKGTVHSKNQSILAVAWATAQQPGRAWASNDVSTDIANYLDAAGCPMVLPRIAEASRWLAARDYAARVMAGQRIREFILDPDVIVPEPDFVKAAKMAAAYAGRSGPSDQDVSTASAAAPIPTTNGDAPVARPQAGGRRPPRRPPVPRRTPATPPWLPTLGDLLARWAADDPTAADAWAADVIAELGDR